MNGKETRPAMPSDGIYYLARIDLKGSTKLINRIRNDAYIDTWGQVVVTAKKFLKSVSGHVRGHLLIEDGDGLLICFQTFPRFVEWYLDFETGIITNPSLGRRLRFRCCLHAGEIRFADGGWRGSAVHDTYKLEKLAKPGSIFVSEIATVLARPSTNYDEMIFRKTSLRSGAATQSRLFRLKILDDTRFVIHRTRINDQVSTACDTNSEDK